MNNSLKKLLAGQSLSVLGSTITERAVSILLKDMSGATQLTGFLLAVAALPTLIVTPLVGVWAENAQPRALVWLNFLSVIASVVLVIGFSFKSTLLIGGALMLAAAITAAFIPVYNRALGAFTPPGADAIAETGQVQSIFSRLATAGGEFGGPRLTAMLGANVFLLDLVSFVLSGFMAWTLPNIPVAQSSALEVKPTIKSRLARFWSDAKEGLALVDLGLLAVLVTAVAIWKTETAVLPALFVSKEVQGNLGMVKAIVEFVTALSMKGLGWGYTNRILSWSGITLGFASILLAASSYVGLDAAYVGAVLLGIGSNMIGVGVSNRLFFVNREATSRVAAIVTVATTIAAMVFLPSVTNVADHYARSMSESHAAAIPFFGAGVLMIVVTVIVFVLVRPRSSN